MSEPARQSAVRRMLLRLGSTYVGVALIGLIAAYLAAASTAPTSVARGLGIDVFEPSDPVELYRYGPFAALCAALCLNLITATLVRVPLRWRSAGALCSHAGLLILALGAAWYTARGISGDSVSVRMGDGVWSPIEHVYVKRTYAAYMARAGPGQSEPVQTEIGGLSPQGPPRGLDVPLGGAPAGAAVRAVRFLPAARLVQAVENTSLRPVPAVRLRITDGERAGTVLLCPAWEDHAFLGGEGYILSYRAGATAESLRKMTSTAPADGPPRMAHDLVLVLAGPELPAMLVLVGTDGRRWQRPLETGKPLDVPLAGRSIRVEALEFLDRAARVWQLADDGGRGPAAPLHAHDGAYAGPALEVEVRAGQFARRAHVPFGHYEHLAPVQWIDLPGESAVGLGFSRRREPLPATLTIRTAEYQTYPASGIPKDYRCDVEIASGGVRRQDTLSLNHPVHVGPYQLSQGSWREDPHDPVRIYLIAATRPALPAIWLGCALICLGFPIAFYVKPLLMRRGRAQP